MIRWHDLELCCNFLDPNKEWLNVGFQSALRDMQIIYICIVCLQHIQEWLYSWAVCQCRQGYVWVCGEEVGDWTQPYRVLRGLSALSREPPDDNRRKSGKGCRQGKLRKPHLFWAWVPSVCEMRWWNAGWETKFFWHSPELGSLLYSLYKISLAQACFPLAVFKTNGRPWRPKIGLDQLNLTLGK